MLAWLQHRLGLTRLEDLFSVLVEDVHVRVDDLETRLAKVELIVEHPVLHTVPTPATASAPTPAEVMRVTS